MDVCSKTFVSLSLSQRREECQKEEKWRSEEKERAREGEQKRAACAAKGQGKGASSQSPRKVGKKKKGSERGKEGE